MPDSPGRDGIHGRVLDSAFSDFRSAWLRGLPGQRALSEERSRPQERCLRLSVDSISALGGITESQFSPVPGYLCGSFPVEASSKFAADGLRAHHAYAEVAQPDEPADSSCAERHHWSEWAGDIGCDPCR